MSVWKLLSEDVILDQPLFGILVYYKTSIFGL